MMQDWFRDAKLGIFIHWGIYSVGRRGGESWPIANGRVSHDEYMTQLDDFAPTRFDPDAWADLFVRSGAKYAVLTTKHHDGVALWPTRQDGPSIPNHNASLPDYVEEYVRAIRDRGLKVGLYFSHTDWSNTDHMQVLLGKSHDEVLALRKEATNYKQLWTEHAARLEQLDHPGDGGKPQAWQRFLDFHRGQLGEILTDYGPIDLIWFDVMLLSKHLDYQSPALRDFIHDINSDTIINSRLGEHGDYETPEQFIPVHPPKGPWELCVTTNNTWSYTGGDGEYKSDYQILTMFCECLGMGGNMLLNVGPDPEGDIPPRQVRMLENLGRWIEKHSEAVHGTRRGLPHGYAYHFSSLNKSRDTLYLYLAHIPKEGTTVKGIHNDIKEITILGDGATCDHRRVGGAPWLGVPGTLLIDVPKHALDDNVTVLKIQLDGPLNLYGGEGIEIDSN